MKAQLIVVQGKPEGKQIPLVGPAFKIGRGETCHLRPNSELVSREHAEFRITADKLTIRDLGSRNGTLVNGKAATEETDLRHGDLVQIGKLTFAVSIQGAAVAASPRAGANGGKPASLDEPGHDEIESWLVSDSTNPTPERPSGIFSGDTITINAFKEAKENKPAAAAPAPAAVAPPSEQTVPADDTEYERLPEGEGDEVDEEEVDAEKETVEASSLDDMPADMIDESNPFFVKKNKGPAQPESIEPAKQAYKDTSDAATDILRKMMERRRSRSS
ncbi:MAG TPA: FHA domain-containing protein [Isosphaeraceae bacterium]|jgi:pSer/pThr/pTyr-binding forkhead associated (FHA) protein|nr:FHA domain-containing protein [Isosphaeraceae bacterium]